MPEPWVRSSASYGGFWAPERKLSQPRPAGNPTQRLQKPKPAPVTSATQPLVRPARARKFKATYSNLPTFSTSASAYGNPFEGRPTNDKFNFTHGKDKNQIRGPSRARKNIAGNTIGHFMGQSRFVTSTAAMGNFPEDLSKMEFNLTAGSPSKPLGQRPPRKPKGSLNKMYTQAPATEAPAKTMGRSKSMSALTQSDPMSVANELAAKRAERREKRRVNKSLDGYESNKFLHPTDTASQPEAFHCLGPQHRGRRQSDGLSVEDGFVPKQEHSRKDIGGYGKNHQGKVNRDVHIPVGKMLPSWESQRREDFDSHKRCEGLKQQNYAQDHFRTGLVPSARQHCGTEAQQNVKAGRANGRPSVNKRRTERESIRRSMSMQAL